MNEKKSIRHIIYNEYIKAAVLPIILVELMLLVMYFSSTSYIEGITKATLLSVAENDFRDIAQREVKSINEQIDSIIKGATVLQKENERLFRTPSAFGLPDGVPEFGVASNGSTYKLNDNNGSSVWYSSITNMTEETLAKAVMTEAMDPLFKATQEANPSIVGIYFNSYDSMCRYYPFLPEVYDVFEYNMEIPTFNFYYLADEFHNPSRTTVWTDAYLDPAGKGWMASCIVPIYSDDGFLQGVTGIDVTIDSIVKNILDLELPQGASAFLVDKNGVILAMPESVEEILELKELRNQVYHSTIKEDTLKPEEFNLFKNDNPIIVNQMHEIFNSNDGINDFIIGNDEYFVSHAIIKETQWSLMVLADKKKVLEPVEKLDKTTNTTGMIAFALMILFYLLFFSYLMYKSKKIAVAISEPIIDIAEKTSEMIYDIQNVSFGSMDKNTEIRELFLLTENFTLMAETLRNFYDELDHKVKNRTLELTEMYENLKKMNNELENEIIERKRTESLLENKKEELENAYVELKQANMQILQQEKMASIGQLAAGVAHEINNPMGFIISNVTTMQEYAQKLIQYIKLMEDFIEKVQAIEGLKYEEHNLKEWVVEIRNLKDVLKIDYIKGDVDDLFEETLEGTSRVKKIVQELRTFSRKQVNMDMANINDGLDSVINIVWNELKYKVNLTKHNGKLPPIYCNIGQLNQVFLNLLMNAVQAIHEKGNIDITTYLEEENIVIEITDTGAGIPEDIMAKIFDPFFTTKEVGVGTGLGLSISYEIVKSYDGTLMVSSKVNEGTTFTIILPIKKNQCEIEE